MWDESIRIAYVTFRLLLNANCLLYYLRDAVVDMQLIPSWSEKSLGDFIICHHIGGRRIVD